MVLSPAVHQNPQRSVGKSVLRLHPDRDCIVIWALAFVKLPAASSVQAGLRTLPHPLFINGETEAQRQAGTCQGPAAPSEKEGPA